MRRQLLALALGLAAIPAASQARAASQTQDGGLPLGSLTAPMRCTGPYETIAYANTFATYELRLENLESEALIQRDRDGGRLTPQHRADLQARLDCLNHLYGVDKLNGRASGRR